MFTPIQSSSAETITGFAACPNHRCKKFRRTSVSTIVPWHHGKLRCAACGRTWETSVEHRETTITTQTKSLWQ